MIKTSLHLIFALQIYASLEPLKEEEDFNNAKKRGILSILSAPARYIKRKVMSIYKKLVKKEPKKADNEVYKEEKLNESQ